MASAPIGAAFTFITLVTGSLWGKPMWGTWWTWDARLTSELVLLFLYLGVIGLHSAIEDARQAARAAAFLALVGVVNLPIVHYSVNWWNTLHQGSTVSLMGQSHITGSMLWPLLTMALATHVYFFASVLARSRVDLLALEGGKEWVREIALASAARDGARAWLISSRMGGYGALRLAGVRGVLHRAARRCAGAALADAARVLPNSAARLKRAARAPARAARASVPMTPTRKRRLDRRRR